MSCKFSTFFAETIDKVISEIVNHFSLPEEEVMEIIYKCTGSSSTPSEKPKKSPVKKASSVKKEDKEEKKESSVVVTPESIAKMTKPELAGVCKSRGLKVSGARQDLIDRILESLKSNQTTLTDAKKTAAKPSLLKKDAPASSVLKKITATASQTLQIKRNKFGNYEHAETGLIFDKDDKVVIGKQADNGEILELNDEDIENCKRFKFNFTMPENLDSRKTGLDDVKVEEVEEELNEEDFEEEVEEEISEEEPEDE